MNKNKINGKVFLDDEGTEWEAYSEAGTGEYYWWTRNIDTDETKEFSTEYVISRIQSYNKDVEYFKNKEIIESNMYNLIKRISNNILRKEILTEENWSIEDIDILNKFVNGKFNITVEN